MRASPGPLLPLLLLIMALLVPAGAAGCGGQERPVRVAAAASLEDALGAAVTAYREATGRRVEVSFTASSTAARQVIEGAPVDLFVSAGPEWADQVEAAGLVAEGGRVDLLGNSLVVVAPADSDLAVADVAGLAAARVGRLALGDPDHVPAGRYARTALVRAGVWQEMRSRVVPARDVRAALALVVQGEVDAGIVYATDARGRPGVRVVLRVPAELHAPVRYPALLLRQDGSDAAADAEDAARGPAREFFDWLQGPVAAEILRGAGFSAPQAE